MERVEEAGTASRRFPAWSLGACHGRARLASFFAGLFLGLLVLPAAHSAAAEADPPSGLGIQWEDRERLLPEEGASPTLPHPVAALEARPCAVEVGAPDPSRAGLNEPAGSPSRTAASRLARSPPLL